MKIYEYYRETANLNLNGSIAAQFLAIFIVWGNLSFFQNSEIMLLTSPFLVYSLTCFQLYLYNMNKSLTINKNMFKSKSYFRSIFDSKHLLVVYQNTQRSRVLLYFPDGYLAGEIKMYFSKEKSFFPSSKTYALYNVHDQIICYFHVKGRKCLNISVYDRNKQYLGFLEKKKRTWKKSKKELIDANGRYIGAIEGSAVYMDEHIVDQSDQQVARLRRGWMPLEWGRLFPEPNTPVLSFTEGTSERDRLLRMSFLINEYFIKR
jgi:hypothetical protein